MTGIQLQFPEAFKYGLMMPNTSIVFGQVDYTFFGMKFNPTTQALEFFRNIGNLDEIKVGEIKMDFSQAR